MGRHPRLLQLVTTSLLRNKMVFIAGDPYYPEVREVLDKRVKDYDAHMVSVEELLERFNSNWDVGLTDEQAAVNLKKYGPNPMHEHWESDGTFMDYSFPLVRRNGEMKKVNVEELTPGDVIYMNPAMHELRIFADIRIVKTFEESPFHVESFLGKRELKPEKTSDDPLKTANLALKGMSMMHTPPPMPKNGTAWGLVCRVGENVLLYQIGKDGKLIEEKKETPEAGWQCTIL